MKVAIIGTGSMGTNHARIYAQMKAVDLVGVCDVNQQQAEKIASLYKTKAYTDYEQMLTENKIDAISIAVPTKYHHKVALYCIKKKIPVLIEKPIAATVTDAQEIITEAKKYTVPILVGHVERYNPAVIELQRLLATGKFGEILSIVTKRIGLYPPGIKDSNVVTDLAVHDLDIIYSLIGKLPSKIFARGGKTFNANVEDHAEIFLDFESFGCFLQVNWITPIKVRTLSVNCSKGYIELNYITQKLTIYENNYLPGHLGGFTEFVEKLGEPPKKVVRIKNKEPLALEINNFLAGIKRKKSFRLTPHDALRALYLSDCIRKSMQQHRAIKVTII